MKDAIAYTHEIEDVCNILYELCENSEHVIDHISVTPTMRTEYGKIRVLSLMERDLSSYSGEFIMSLNRNILEDLKFFVRGLIFIMEHLDENNL